MTVFRNEIDALLNSLLEAFYEKVTFGTHFRDSSQISREYYIRHTIETILRIRLARIADAKVLNVLTRINPIAAKRWANYSQEEMLHDKLFLDDLKRLDEGAAENAYKNKPLLSTKLLQGFVYYTIEHESPLGILSKSYFLEYITAKTQREWIENTAKSIGSNNQKGALAHVGIDTHKDHAKDVWDVLMMFVETDEDKNDVKSYMRIYASLFGAYFEELHSITQKNSSEFTCSMMS